MSNHHATPADPHAIHADRHPQRARGRLRHKTRQTAMIVVAFSTLYAVGAYLLMPLEWERYLRQHPALKGVANVTTTGDGHPGDPLNVALVGSEQDLKTIMIQAGYYPADPLTLRSCLAIAGATVLARPYDHAPVSHLYYYGRREDLAFEYPVGHDPRQRHHVRFWKAPPPEVNGRPLWIGQTSFDTSVGLSHTTGQVTHHIDPAVDDERDFLFDKLRATRRLSEITPIDDFHPVRHGINGGGDPWRTDGRLFVGNIEEP